MKQHWDVYKLETKMRSVALTLLTFSFGLTAYAQTGNIEGHIIDRDGKALPGVTISIDRLPQVKLRPISRKQVSCGGAGAVDSTMIVCKIREIGPGSHKISFGNQALHVGSPPATNIFHQRQHRSTIFAQ